jgi:hypothetical protein
MLQGPCACGAWHTFDEWNLRPAFTAQWINGKWRAKTNDSLHFNFEFVDAPMPDGVEITLPVPRFNVGDRIRFKWDRGYLQGTIIEIRCSIPYAYLGSIVYEVREIGHRRTVYDKGNADITRI